MEFFARETNRGYSKRNSALLAIVFIISFTILSPCTARSQDATIARDLANPFSSIWNIVNQINFSHVKGGPLGTNETQFDWNFQPVMPIPLNDQFNLIIRPVIPYYRNPYVGIAPAAPFDFTDKVDFISGLGDMAIGAILSALEKVRKEKGRIKEVYTLTHLAFPTDEQIDRIRRFDAQVVTTVQPGVWPVESDSVLYYCERATHAYPTRPRCMPYCYSISRQSLRAA